MPLFLKGRKKTDGKRIVLMPKKHQLKINVSGINNNNNSRTYGIKDSRLYNKSYQNLAVDSIANNKGGGNSRILSANFLNENYSKSNNKRSKSITGCSSINSSSILMNKHLFDKVSNNKRHSLSVGQRTISLINSNKIPNNERLFRTKYYLKIYDDLNDINNFFGHKIRKEKSSLFTHCKGVKSIYFICRDDMYYKE